jgi:hypothetical protein
LGDGQTVLVGFLQGLFNVFPRKGVNNGAAAAVAATTLLLLHITNKQVDGAVTVVIVLVV